MAHANDNQHVHDPHIIKAGRYYYVFSTGPGVQIRRSKDLVSWTFVGRVFTPDVPEWAKKEIPEATSVWAPDISYYGGRYRLYYTVSRFGTNTSFIGLATNRALDPASKEYAWKDAGMVIRSTAPNDYNAIDANLVDAGGGKYALSFGSYWRGIELVDLDPETGKPPAGAPIRYIAGRPNWGAIEAPHIIRRGGYYYLFVSFDRCCRGVRSTYNIRYGRSKTLDGPYVDREGKPMLDGGGTLLLATEGRYIGPGHCSILKDGRRTLMAYHYYDGEAGGIATIQVRPLNFTKDGWVTVGPPFGAPDGKP
ncbi:MAG TPA: arabinan endo-1,5-alpha-L-arabinosidase [Armatimonadota bacterium]